MILEPHPQLQWFHVQIGDATQIFRRNLAVLRIIFAHIRLSTVMEVALLVTTSLISCPLILLSPVPWLLTPLLPLSSGKLAAKMVSLRIWRFMICDDAYLQYLTKQV